MHNRNKYFAIQNIGHNRQKQQILSSLNVPDLQYSHNYKKYLQIYLDLKKSGYSLFKINERKNKILNKL